MSQEWTPPPSADAPASVPNYLIPAILSAVCCFPLGIISIIFAAQVNGKVASGDIPGALDASKKAKLFSYIFLGLGILLWGGYLIFAFVIGGLSIFANS
ncbi:MAG TPA: CD225/dispanin family protein [Pyrinomonadaceae bacterium]|nr:CD225/dispanin family protein [Pyrinomonadaceae bacterium]